MKKWLALFAFSVAFAAAMPSSDALTIVELRCRLAPAPESIRSKVLEMLDQPNAGLLNNAALASEAEARDLRAWWEARSACRQSEINRVAVVSRAAANLRRTTYARGEEILNELIARKISYGRANRLWAQGELDFNRLYANMLSQRVLPVDPITAPAPPTDPTDALVRQQMQNNADSNRMIDDALKARQDAARPALCPSNPAGLPGPAPDPVSQPFC